MTAPTTPLTRYAADSRGVAKLGHLVDPAALGDDKKLTPAICGKKHRRWRPVRMLISPASYHPCPECTRAAGEDTSAAEPTRIAPRAVPSAGNYVPPTAALTPAENTQAGRTLRRLAFRDGIACSTAAERWRPTEYENRLDQLNPGFLP